MSVLEAAPDGLCAPVAAVNPGWHVVRLAARKQLAAQVWQFELEPETAMAYPFEQVVAGAHIDVELPNGAVRQYSLLTSDEVGLSRLVIAAKRDSNGRGGSVHLCDAVQLQSRLRISAPRNHFALQSGEAPTMLFAGGIGITPIWSMVQELQRRGSAWTLHYAARSRSEAPLLEGLACLPNVHLHFDDEAAGRAMDIASFAMQAPSDAHLYCCGPAAMLDAFEASCKGRDASHIHLERFSAAQLVSPSGASHACTLRLARSGIELQIESGQSILELVRSAGVDAPSSCEQGICGACETAVLEGDVEHRDSILSHAEKEASRTMMICCSLAKGTLLVLDL